MAPVGQGWRALLAADFDPAREIVFPEGPVLDADVAGACRIVGPPARPDEIEARLPAPAYVVAGGRLRSRVAGHDRRPAHARVRANVAFRAVAVPAGVHNIRFLYRPFSVKAGLVVSALAVALGPGLPSGPPRTRARASGMIARGSAYAPPRAAGAALALQARLLLSPATIAGQAFFRRDVHLMWQAQARCRLGHGPKDRADCGTLLVSFGQPLLGGREQPGLLPLALPPLLRPWTFYTCYAVLHLALAGGGAAFLGRRLGLAWLPAGQREPSGCARSPALAGRHLEPAGGRRLDALGHRRRPANVSARGLRPALAWALFTALQVLAGAPEMVVFAAAGIALLAVALARRDRVTWESTRRALLGTALAAVLAVGLAACQWAPALQAARLAGRTELPREARTHWSVHPLHLAQSVCPLPLHRLALTAQVRQDLFGAPDPFLPSIYLGVIGAALVAAALSRPSRLTIGLAAVAVLSTLGALGRHAGLHDVVVALAPPLRAFRYPAKALLLASLAWCVLCGFGLAGLGDKRSRKCLAIVAASLAVVVTVVSCSLAFGGAALLERFIAASGLAAARHLGWRMSVAALLAALACGLALRGAAAPARALVGLAVLDLTLAHFDLNPTAPVALYTHPPAALSTALDPEDGRLFAWDYLEPGASRLHLGREVPYFLARAPVGWDLRAAQALGLREVLFPPTAASWGAAGSYDRDVPGLEPGPMALLKAAFRSASTEQRLRLLRLGAVSRVAALHADAGRGLEPLGRYEGSFVDPVLVFAVRDARPRAYVVGTARIRANDAEALAALLEPAFAPEREVVLASGPGGEAVGFAGSARVLDRRADRVTLEAQANGPGWLVLVDAWNPAGS